MPSSPGVVCWRLVLHTKTQSQRLFKQTLNFHLEYLEQVPHIETPHSQAPAECGEDEGGDDEGQEGGEKVGDQQGAQHGVGMSRG